jgi:hypothetical protein
MKVSSLLSPVCPPGQVEESIVLVSPAFFMAPSSNLLTVNMSHLRECFTYWHRSCAAKTSNGELVPDGASDLGRHLAVFVSTETSENREGLVLPKRQHVQCIDPPHPVFSGDDSPDITSWILRWGSKNLGKSVNAACRRCSCSQSSSQFSLH